jgi:uncharacterized protein (DUF1697 family)
MRWVALLRGINVGGNNTVDMKRLKQATLADGLEDVSTYINSGNLIFTATDEETGTTLASRVERIIADEFALTVPAVVRGSATINTVAAAIPTGWRNDSEHKTDVLFLWDAVARPESVVALNGVDGVDDLVYVDGSIVWHVDRSRYNASAMSQFVKNPVYKQMTARNANTVRRLAVLMSG